MTTHATMTICTASRPGRVRRSLSRSLIAAGILAVAAAGCAGPEDATPPDDEVSAALQGADAAGWLYRVLTMEWGPDNLDWSSAQAAVARRVGQIREPANKIKCITRTPVGQSGVDITYDCSWFLGLLTVKGSVRVTVSADLAATPQWQRVHWSITSLSVNDFVFTGATTVTHINEGAGRTDTTFNIRSSGALKITAQATGSLVRSGAGLAQCLTLDLLGVVQTDAARVSASMRGVTYCSDPCPRSGTVRVAGRHLHQVTLSPGAATVTRDGKVRPMDALPCAQ